VVRDGAVAGSHFAPTGANGGAAAAVLGQALVPLGLPAERLDGIVAIGAGKEETGLAAEAGNEVLCAARGVRRLFPDCRGVIDLGGESTQAFKLDEAGNVLELAVSDKCAAGTGVFLEAVGKLMGIGPEEMGPLALQSSADIAIATRMFGLVGRVGLGAGTVAIGGLAQNVGIRSYLEQLMKAPLVVPERPQTVGALGAALVAAERRGAP